MANKDIFCAAPFIHNYIGANGKNRVCCVADKKSYQTYDLKDWNSKDYQYIRNHMLTSDKWLPECEDCRLHESVLESGSYRQAQNKMWKDLGSPSLDVIDGNILGVPLTYDLRLNNMCNLSCRMCGPNASSQLYKESLEHPELWPGEHVDESHKRNIDHILDNASFIRDIKLLGGEPTIQPEVREILQKLIDCDNTNIKVSITTNGTNTHPEFYNLLKKFKRVFISFSIDSYGEKLKYIRGGSNFHKIWKNVQKIINLDWAGESSFKIQQVVMIYNVFDFWELRQEIKKLNLPITHRSWVVHNPETYCIQNIPQKWKDVVIKILKENNAYEDEKHIVDFMNNQKENIDLLKSFKARSNLMDMARNIYLKDYHPLCHEMLEEIG